MTRPGSAWTDAATAPEYVPVFITAIMLYAGAQRLAEEHGIDHPEVVHDAQRAHQCLMAAAGTIYRARDAARPRPFTMTPTLFDETDPP